MEDKAFCSMLEVSPVFSIGGWKKVGGGGEAGKGNREKEWKREERKEGRKDDLERKGGEGTLFS